jgi:hypothetical protein
MCRILLRGEVPSLELSLESALTFVPISKISDINYKDGGIGGENEERGWESKE